ncbi:MAG: SEL1-like repeat protein [Hyphomicrobiales bacterium]|nr:SEL1-like repeat protein [Hyphomicrobiales bacterium]
MSGYPAFDDDAVDFDSGNWEPERAPASRPSRQRGDARRAAPPSDDLEAAAARFSRHGAGRAATGSGYQDELTRSGPARLTRNGNPGADFDPDGYSGFPISNASHHERHLGMRRSPPTTEGDLGSLSLAIDAMDRRHRASQIRTETALANISQWIDVNEERRDLDRKALDAVARKLDGVRAAVAGGHGEGAPETRAAVAALARRLESMEDRVNAPTDAASVDAGLRAALARLENRMDAMMAPQQPDLLQALNAFDRKIEALNQKIDQVPQAAGGHGAARPVAAGRATGRAAMIELARRQRELDLGKPAAPAQSPETSSLDRRLEAISARLDAITTAKPPVLDTTPLASEMQRLAARIDDLAGQPRTDPATAAVAAELAQLSKRLDRLTATPVADAGRQGSDLARMAANIDALAAGNARRDGREAEFGASLRAIPEQQAQIASQLRGDIKDLSRALDALPDRATIAGLEEALHNIAERIATTRGAGATDELLRPMEQMTRDLQGAVRDMDPRGALEGLRVEIRALSTKLLEISTQKADPQSLSVISAQVADLRSAVSGAAATSFPAERLEQQIAALGERLDKIAAQTAAPAFGRAPKPDISGLAADIRGMVDRAMPTQLLGSLDQRLKELDARIAQNAAQAPQDMPGAALAARMNEMQASLERRIAEKPAAQFDTTPFNALADRIDRMQAALEGPREATFDLAPFEGLLREISQKIDNPRDAQMQGQDLGTIEGLLRDLSQRVGTPAPDTAAPVDLAPHLAEIADHLARSDQGMHQLGEVTQAQFARLSDRIDQVQSAVSRQMQGEGASAQAGSDAALGSIIATMETLSQRIDAVRAASLTPQTFETMLESLVARMDAARGPAASAPELQALEQQIDKIAVEVQKSTATGATLAHLEQTVSDLLAQIEAGHFASHAEAEATAKAAAQEALRQTLINRSQAGDPESVHEIAELRMLQQTADQRTASTLHVLHDTLEKIVDRLTSLETRTPEAAAAASVPAMPAEPFELAAATAAPSISVAPASPPPVRQAPVSDMFADDGDFLIEPGTSGSARRSGLDGADTRGADIAGLEGAKAHEPKPATSTKQDFIAAARRSAMAAALDSVNEAGRPSRSASRGPAARGQNGNSRVMSFMQSRRKPLLLAASALLILFGAMRILPHLGNHGVAAPAAITAPITTAPVRPAPGAAAPLGSSDARPPAAAVTPADPGKPRKSASLGIDTMPTGSIASSAALPAMVMPQHFPSQVSDAALVRLANSGNAAAEYTLGMHIMGGKDAKYKLSDAAGFIQKAADKGLVPAQFQLAALYEKGIGVAKNPARAQHLYQQAADAGNIRAMYNLGVMLAAGAHGKPDYGTAAVWFRRAAERGIHDSQFNLAILYARGLGVPRDMAKAWAWFDIAANTGDQGAARNRDDLARHMSSADLAKAKAQVAAFRLKPSFPKINVVANPTKTTTGT